MSAIRKGFFTIILLALGAWPVLAKVFATQEESLEQMFPECTVSRQTVYLTREQQERAAQLAGVDVPSALVHLYVAERQGTRVGTAYFDTHLVRTLPETLMVVVSSGAEVKNLRVVVFSEPLEYLPRAEWYQQFLHHRLDEGLALKRDINGVSGATLSARAATEAVRRILALHQVIHEPNEP